MKSGVNATEQPNTCHGTAFLRWCSWPELNQHDGSVPRSVLGSSVYDSRDPLLPDASAQRILSSHEYHRVCHHLADLSLLREAAVENYFAGIVTLRQDTDQIFLRMLSNAPKSRSAILSIASQTGPGVTDKTRSSWASPLARTGNLRMRGYSRLSSVGKPTDRNLLILAEIRSL